LPRPGAVDLNGDGVEQHRRRELADHIGGTGLRGRPERAVTELGSAREVEVTPGAVLGAVAELLVGVGEHLSGSRVLRVREDGMVGELRGPPVVTSIERRTSLLDDSIDATDRVDVARGSL